MSFDTSFRTGHTARGFRPTGIACVLALLAACGEARADTLDRELLAQAPRVLRYLRDHGHRGVGVLKFRVRKGDAAPSDSVGSLNLNLASRLEMALVLANDAKDPLGIARNASAVAAGIPGANHLSREGREALFTGRYPPAWGDADVVPDAFLTGVVAFSTDLRQVSVGVVAFDRKGGPLDKVVQFTATTDAPLLSEAGEGFVLSRGLFDGGRAELTQAAIGLAAKVNTGQAPNPVRDPAAPVALEIRYDGKPVPFEFKGGKARVPEPAEGQKVTFVLRRTADDAAGRLAVVLSVNGENTLFKERLTPLQSQKWVLEPGAPPITVRGYQTAAGSAEAFRVLSGAQSAKDVIKYGPDSGTIGLDVFRERKSPPPAPTLDDESEDLAALSRGTFPKDRPANLWALKSQLRVVPATGPRGLIVQGQKVDAATKHVEFQADPTPVMSATITYFQPEPAARGAGR